MEEQSTNRQQGTLEISAREFSRRMNQLMDAAESPDAKANSVYSRLALIHQVAKACVSDSLKSGEYADIEIEEITDPPLYDPGMSDEAVIIYYSYTPQNPFD